MQKTLLLCLVLLGTGISLWAQTGSELLLKIEAYERSAQINMDQEQYKEAEREMDKAIELMPLKASLYYTRSLARLYRKNYDGMFFDLSKAIRLDPENPNYYFQRGCFLREAGYEKDAIKDFNEGLQLVNEGDSLYYRLLSNRSTTYLSVRRLEEAWADAEIVLARDSNHVVILNAMGIILTDMDRAEESLPYFLRAFELEPERTELIGNIGWGYLCAERYDESLIWYNRMVKANPKSGFGYSNRGYLKIQMGDLKGAAKDLKKAIKYDESNSYAYKNRALLYIEMEEYEQACEELNLAEQYEFLKYYGPEVKELQEKYCQ